MTQTELKFDDILKAIHFPVTGGGVAYEKFAQKASGFALAGVAVRIVNSAKGTVVVGVTGVAAVPYRATAVESALSGGPIDEERILRASKLTAESVDPLGDIHASPEYRAHLATVLTRRALIAAASQ